MFFIVLYKLSDSYYEIVKNVGTVEDDRKEDDTVNDTVNDTINLLQLTERQRKIYEAIKNVPVNVPINVPVNAPNFASMLGVSEKTIKRDIAAMQSAGLIKRVGSDKTGHMGYIPSDAYHKSRWKIRYPVTQAIRKSLYETTLAYYSLLMITHLPSLRPPSRIIMPFV